MSWGYDEINGPTTWFSNYPAANGCRQSPINIETNKVVQERKFLFKQPLTPHYDTKNHTYTLCNTGSSWQVNVHGSASVLEGGPLEKDRYELVQFHAHWGRHDDHGSEHTINNRHYSAEIHFVHWNKDRFISFEQAASQPGGLAVIGVLCQLGSENKELNKICNSLEEITSKGQQKELLTSIDPTGMFPGDRSYWCYEGSLTTPPCHESVTWIVFKTPIDISWEQLQTFRALTSGDIDGCCNGNAKINQISENTRPVQPLGARIVSEIPYW